MVKKSTKTEIWTAVIVGLLVVIFSNPIQNILEPPEAIPIVQYGEKVCPTQLNLFDGKSSFSIKLQNAGDDGILFVKLSSDKILSRKDATEMFNTTSVKAWVSNSKQYQDFNFEIGTNESSVNDNFTMSFEYGCYETVWGFNFFCKQSKRCCNYKKNPIYSGNYYDLVNEVC